MEAARSPPRRRSRRRTPLSIALREFLFREAARFPSAPGEPSPRLPLSIRSASFFSGKRPASHSARRSRRRDPPFLAPRVSATFGGSRARSATRLSRAMPDSRRLVSRRRSRGGFVELVVPRCAGLARWPPATGRADLAQEREPGRRDRDAGSQRRRRSHGVSRACRPRPRASAARRGSPTRSPRRRDRRRRAEEQRDRVQARARAQIESPS